MGEKNKTIDMQLPRVKRPFGSFLFLPKPNPSIVGDGKPRVLIIVNTSCLLNLYVDKMAGLPKLTS